jgi:hypothetical protein
MIVMGVQCHLRSMYSRFDNTFNQFLLRLHFGERLMLVTFTKNNHANITMFGVNAVHT